MPSRLAQTVTLTPHPALPSAAVHRVSARVTPQPGHRLALTYTLEGALDRVRVPTPRPARFADELWRHTCCEIFIARKGDSAYHELNFSPSGEWAVYAFRRRRERMPLERGLGAGELEPNIIVRSTGARLELDAVVPLDRLSPGYIGARLVLGVSAVVEDRDGACSYWALKHPADQPDFHHPDAFVLELA
ncbi:MAG: DOMON-like domain-containing protein [Sulfurifustis sp.]